MPVEILSFPSGIAFARDAVSDGITRILKHQIEDPDMRSSLLGEGEYDISPTVGNTTHTHQVIVFEKGNAVLRAVSSRRVWEHIFSGIDGLDKFKGVTLRMPQDSEIAAVTSVENDGEAVRVFEILIYQPPEE